MSNLTPVEEGPVRKAFTQEELRDFCLKFMRKETPLTAGCGDGEKERYYTDLGLLIHFVGELWEHGHD